MAWSRRSPESRSEEGQSRGPDARPSRQAGASRLSGAPLAHSSPPLAPTHPASALRGSQPRPASFQIGSLGQSGPGDQHGPGGGVQDKRAFRKREASCPDGSWGSVGGASPQLPWTPDP